MNKLQHYTVYHIIYTMCRGVHAMRIGMGLGNKHDHKVLTEVKGEAIKSGTWMWLLADIHENEEVRQNAVLFEKRPHWYEMLEAFPDMSFFETEGYDIDEVCSELYANHVVSDYFLIHIQMP